MKAIHTRTVDSARTFKAWAGDVAAGLKGRKRKQGFTFVELMVAIVILIVIAALALPSLQSVSDDSRFKSACDQLSSVASVCRAEAKRTGKPIAVVATKGQDGRQTIVSVPLGDAQDLHETGGTVEVDSRVLMIMPHGVTVYADRLDEPAQGESKAGDVSISVEGDDAGTQSLIIYWANGEATTSAPFGVKSATGRTAAAKVNSWTGALSIGREPEPTTSASIEDEADEPSTTAQIEDQLDEHAEQDPYPVNSGSPSRMPALMSPEG